MVRRCVSTSHRSQLRRAAATNKWQTVTETEVTAELLTELAAHCSEFLIHAADVEGLCAGIDEVRPPRRRRASQGRRSLLRSLDSTAPCRARTRVADARCQIWPWCVFLSNAGSSRLQVERLSGGRVDLTFGRCAAMWLVPD